MYALYAAMDIVHVCNCSEWQRASSEMKLLLEGVSGRNETLTRGVCILGVSAVGMTVHKTASSFPSVGLVFVVLIHHSMFTTAFTSRGLMSSGVSYYATPDHSADYKITQVMEIVGTVEDGRMSWCCSLC